MNASSDKLSPEELKSLYEKGNFSPHSDDKIFSDSKYSYESLKSAPFFGEETLGIYLKIYETLGKKGHSPSLYELGLLYYNGEWWLPKDFGKSSAYHHKAAELGNTDAMFELHVYYAKGIGVDQNNDTAMEWCKKAAELNHHRACYNMGAFYASGNGVPQNMETAVTWYDKASKAGSGQASATLGVMYKLGSGVKANDKKGNSYIDIHTFLKKFGLTR
ncbi:MAG: hypothetical protein K0S32_139 [Bacteroidetes bacterium]|nr:hypothetical protein [Bacteroidota bacterium]